MGKVIYHPVVLGDGTPYFPALEQEIHLRLVDTHTFGSGVVYLCYLRADEGKDYV